MVKIIVRADDLGYSEAVNYGIAKTVEEGIIRNVGLMVNMPATEHGLNLIKNKNICLGCHVVICAGSPISDFHLLPSLTTDNGQFKSSKVYRTAKNDFVSLGEVVTEIEAQYQRFVSLTGEKPKYFEGHAVESPNFVEGLKVVAKRHGLSFLNFSFDGRPVPFRGKYLYVSMDSLGEDYDPFITLKNVVNERHKKGYSVMICHPGFLDSYILQHSSLTIPRTEEVDMLCDSKTKEWLNQHNVDLITYDEV